MIDSKFIGYRFAPSQFAVERGRIAQFARAIGATDAIYFDAAAAHTEGYANVVAPPTFLTVAETDRAYNSGAAALPAGFDLDLTRLLHGEQEYEYLLPICAGEVLDIGCVIKDIYSKRDGALQFIVTEMEYRKASGELAAISRATSVYRSPVEIRSENNGSHRVAEDEAKISAALPTLHIGPISRATLALYAGASGDFNPIHIDSDFARQAGVGDVFAHGMLNMAYLGRLLTRWQPQHRLRKYRARFKHIVHVHDALTCDGTVRAVESDGAQCLASVDLKAANQYGVVALEGEAVVVL